jgi:alginate O-acetyltransferase complex protein AlgF
MTCIRHLISLMLILCLGFVAQAQEGLYGPQTPQDTAFVRFVHVATSVPEATFSVAGVPFATTEYAHVTPYDLLAEGTHTISVDELTTELTTEIGGFYTVVLMPEDLLVITDTPLEDPAKARLFLYNLSTLDTIDLKTADGETEVLTGVAAESSSSVEVNPADVTLAVFHQGEVVQELSDLQLERGTAYGIFVMGDGESLTVHHAVAETRTE